MLQAGQSKSAHFDVVAQASLVMRQDPGSAVRDQFNENR